MKSARILGGLVSLGIVAALAAAAPQAAGKEMGMRNKFQQR
jgi:hypothetical protein